LPRIPLGAEAERRYGAPYWSIHRADLQAALSGGGARQSRHRAALGTRVEDFIVHANGLSSACRRGARRPTSTASH
jgi:salicylate hydroxylase